MEILNRSGILVNEVRVRNFRSLKSVDIKLDRLTVLVGANNAGKTSFLEALNAAIGTGSQSLGPEDIYLSPDESAPPLERSILIDVLIKPVVQKGGIVESFPEGSYWLDLWRTGVSQDDNDDDFVAIRTRFIWDRLRGEYSTERFFLREWTVNSTNIEAIGDKKDDLRVAGKQLQPIALHFMDAKRDIEDDIKRPGSFWRKLTNDLGLKENEIEALEKELSGINETIVKNSKVLTYLKSNLGTLYKGLFGDQEKVDLSPVSGKLRDLTKGIDVTLATKDAQAFPLSRHGMGTRSMASIFVFKTFMKWQTMNAKAEPIHPMLVLEEPEAHLHPQAQRALFGQIENIPGQSIISTHSPYVTNQTTIDNFRHFQKKDAHTIVSSIDTSDFQEEDHHKIKWKVLNTRGDLLFANALILFEGETEEQAFPLYAREYWGRNAHELGLNFVAVGGKGAAYLPFLRLAQGLDINWYILSDGDVDAPKKLDDALKKITTAEQGNRKNVIILPEGQNIEIYLIEAGYADVVESFLNSHFDYDDYLNRYINDKNDQSGKGGIPRNYKADSDGGRKRALLDILKASKTQFSEALARKVVSLDDKERRVPPKIKELFDRIAEDIGIPKAAPHKNTEPIS
ncbi:MAG: AAA family ATPase [bacterium]|nr:AAA family ATPase [bacterium]